MESKPYRRIPGLLMMGAIPILIAGGLVLSAAMPAFSTTVVKLNDEDLVALSSMVIEGNVTSVHSAWNAKHTQINTLVVMKVSRCLKGQEREDASITLHLLGGQVGDDIMELVGGPTFATGEDVIVFVAADGTTLMPITGLFQGKFTISTDASTGQRMVVGREMTRDAFVDKIARIVTAQEEGR